MADAGSSNETTDDGQDETFETESIADLESKYTRLYRLVPSIGSAWRWYDIPYRVLRWMRDSRAGRRLPITARIGLGRAMGFFLSFDHLDRLKIESRDYPASHLAIPAGEKLTQGGIWAIELFPPSRYAALRKALKKNGWDRDRHITGIYESNAEVVAEARRRTGYSWFRLGEVASLDPKVQAPDAKRESLPPEFSRIELSSVQLGPSLTAIVAFFHLSEHGQNALEQVWQGTHQPTLKWQGLRRPRVEDSRFTAIRDTQSERKRLHDACREWLGSAAPGFFADTESGHPIVDFNLFAKFDPATTGPEEHREMSEALRALGMDGDSVYRYASPQIKGATIVETDSGGGPSEVLRNCWAVMGQRDAISNLNSIWVSQSAPPYAPGTLAFQFQDFVEAFLLHVGIARYAAELRGLYVASRDEARSRYQRFNLRGMRHLRRELLSTSLDLSVVARDASRVGAEPRAVKVWAQPYLDLDGPGFDVIERFHQRTTAEFSALLDEDSDYRDVLSTVAAIGSSADASRVGRLALWVSGASLAVALVTLLVADIADQTLWSQFVRWALP